MLFPSIIYLISQICVLQAKGPIYTYSLLGLHTHAWQKGSRVESSESVILGRRIFIKYVEGNEELYGFVSNLHKMLLQI